MSKNYIPVSRRYYEKNEEEVIEVCGKLNMLIPVLRRIKDEAKLTDEEIKQVQYISDMLDEKMGNLENFLADENNQFYMD